LTGSTTNPSGTAQSTPIAKPQRVPYNIYLQLLAMVLIWGIGWTITKPALRSISPVNFAAVRFAGAVVIMAGLTLAMRSRLLPAAGERLPLGVVGAVQIGGSQLLSTLALYYVGAGRAVVLLYSLQLWALPLSWLVNRERLGWRAILGGVVGFGGMFLFVNPMMLNWHDRQVWMGNGIGLAAGFSWALGACLYRRRSWTTSFWTQTWWQVVWSAVLTSVVGLLFGRHSRIEWSWIVLFALFWAWIGATALCWWFWAKALAVMPAWRASQMAALTPIVGVITSAIFTDERITATVTVSIVLICSGTWVSLSGRNRG
jgi:drug/metabolite transporter (DMT)-like permease